jgi:hypothetical protein
MPEKCCVPECRSNYLSEKKDYVSMFKFPSLKRAELRDKWLRNIPRKDFTPSSLSAVCIKHFRQEDVITFDEFTDV